MKRLFVDMDGVLTEFKNVASIDELYNKEYFKNLTPMKNVIDAINDLILCPCVEVNILSAYLSESLYALSEKHSWLNTYLPSIKYGNRIFIPCNVKKLDAIAGVDKDSYLLDDYTQNLLVWEQKGTGIKLINNINHKTGIWKGLTVSYDSQNLKNDLLQAMELEECMEG